MSRTNYQGKLLIANPLVVDSSLNESVFVVVDQSNVSINTICINKTFNNSNNMFNDVMMSLGLNSSYCESELYVGGVESRNRIFLLHSMDWSGLTTVQLTDDIGFTSDISILTALSENQGPEYFKPCAGFNRWDLKDVEKDLKNSKFSITDANIEICFEVGDLDMWKSALYFSAKQQVDKWF